MNQNPPNIELPELYYLNNFSVLLNSVYQRYQDLLNEEERQLKHEFDTLSISSQCLYVRLLSRKGPWIRKDKLQYQEINNITNCLQELKTKQFAFEANIQSLGSEKLETFLNLLTKNELVTVFNLKGYNTLRKQALIERLVLEQDQHVIAGHLFEKFCFIQPGFLTAFETYLLCFFGNSHQSLSEFVISDLGHVTYENYELCDKNRFYNQRNEIEIHKHYIQLDSLIEEDAIQQDAETLFQLAAELTLPPDHIGLQRRYEKRILKLARQLERLEHLQWALQLYDGLSMHPAQERTARILKKQQQTKAALNTCLLILEQGTHPEELEFAHRFGANLARSLGEDFPLSKNNVIIERQATLIKQDESVEILAASYFNESGIRAFYVENQLFCSLFGLFFWDIIFTPIPGAFLNPFQRGPLDLHTEYFYLDRKHIIDQRLEELNTNHWQQRIWQAFRTKQGISNHFVSWPALDEALINIALQHIPAQHLQAVFQRMLRHPGLYRNGFPDLICFNEHSYELIEVKAPGDVLQPNQKRWFRFFNQHDIPASVLKVHWLEDSKERNQ